MLKERFDSFKYAFQGIVSLFKSEPNARIHLIFTLVSLFAAWFFQISVTEWCFIILCISLVFSAEALNTSIEALTDLVSPEHHPLAGKAKDVAAAAVLILAIGAAAVGLIIFLPKMYAYVF